MENKLTAVEWLADVFAKMGYVSTELLIQAKAMEKQQIIDAFDNGYCQETIGYNASEQYYNETFNK